MKNSTSASDAPIDCHREVLRRHLQAAVQPRQLIYAAVKLGIPDALRSGPRQAGDLAPIVGANSDALRRVLRGLVTLDLVVEDEAGRFALTPTGELLCRGVPGSLRGEALLHAELDQAWCALLPAIKSGETAFNRIFGRGIFDHVAADPELNAYYNHWMAADREARAAAVAAAYPFPAVGTVLDVGGGHGGLLTAILRREPGLRGLLFDQPHVVAGARETLDALGVAEQCEVIAGDFFASIPAGADLYVLHRIIHDWDDEAAARILSNCHRAMGTSARLLLIEKVMPEQVAEAPSVVRLDLDMLVVSGGRQRTEGEYRNLLTQCGFDLTRTVPIEGETSVLEAVRRGP